MVPDKKFYESYAKSYPDDLVVRGSQLAIIKKHLKVKNKIGLDIGSANGAFTLELARSGAKKVYGIDLANSFVKKATTRAKKEKLKNVEFRQADAQKLPFKNNTFDFIICTEVLEHVSDFKLAIKEIERVLKPGGEFIVTVPNSLNPAEILHQLKHILFYVLKDDPITHINLFFEPTVKKHFSFANKIETRTLHFILPFFPKKFVNHKLIKKDLQIGNLLKPFAFDNVVIGKK